MNLHIVNEKPKVPFKSLKSEMDIHDFVEFITECLDCNPCNTYWAFNYNNPEWSPAVERPFLDFIRAIDPQELITQSKFTNIEYGFGDMIVIYTKDNIEVHLVYAMEDYWENEVCEDCFSTLFGCDEEEERKDHILKMLSDFPIIQHDQSRDSDFSNMVCDCCGSKLAGKRYFLICIKEDKE
jgi:hypothetical protein